MVVALEALRQGAHVGVGVGEQAVDDVAGVEEVAVRGVGDPVGERTRAEPLDRIGADVVAVRGGVVDEVEPLVLDPAQDALVPPAGDQEPDRARLLGRRGEQADEVLVAVRERLVERVDQHHDRRLGAGLLERAPDEPVERQPRRGAADVQVLDQHPDDLGAGGGLLGARGARDLGARVAGQLLREAGYLRGELLRQPLEEAQRVERRVVGRAAEVRVGDRVRAQLARAAPRRSTCRSPRGR